MHYHARSYILFFLALHLRNTRETFFSQLLAFSNFGTDIKDEEKQEQLRKLAEISLMDLTILSNTILFTSLLLRGITLPFLGLDLRAGLSAGSAIATTCRVLAL
ncbi:hypothetical protein L484_003453 [Morus notabilis]|uniref:Uncharacterized protein n=1 Tax=Morus notabilis TaxID=981085 RepID=W9RR89_9ROSA|nr:hypothetical protein L484_003453 [Morus notabilis]